MYIPHQLFFMTYLNPGERVYRIFTPARRSPAFLKYFLVSIVFFVLLVGYLFAGVPLADVLPVEHVVALCAGIALIFWLTGEYKRHNFGYYILTNNRIIVRRGLFSTRIDSVSYSLIVNVKSNQRFLDKILNIGTIEISTARGSQEIDLVGIRHVDDVGALIMRFVQAHAPR